MWVVVAGDVFDHSHLATPAVALAGEVAKAREASHVDLPSMHGLIANSVCSGPIR